MLASRKGTNRAARGAQSASRDGNERRTRNRLRELCDEVLASYRIAQGQDFVTAEDRDAASQLLRSLAPRAAR